MKSTGKTIGTTGKMTRRQFVTSAVAAGVALHATPLFAAEKAAWQVEEQATDEAWKAIKEFLFQDRPVDEGNPIAKLVAPYRAQNGADVSVQVNALAGQTEQSYIKKHYLVADANPSPVIGEFGFSSRNGRADVATRIRVDQSTHVRAISETQDGRLFMQKAFVKSSGGCSAPPVSDSELAALNLGKTRLIEEPAQDGLRKIHISIMHPNNTGLQRDTVTELTIPPHYVTEVIVSNGAGEEVFSVSGDISFSENPSFEFYYKSKAKDVLVARVKDSQGKEFTSSKLTLAAL